MDGRNNYERAFVAWLHFHQLAYLPVDDSQRRAVNSEFVKSPDLFVYDRWGHGYVVDVKGRRFPGGSCAKPRRVWERWCTRQDCSSLLAWERLLGAESLLVFVYLLHSEAATVSPPNWFDAWTFQGASYALCGILVKSYIEHMRLRSPRWDTVSLPSAAFHTLARPVSVIFRLRDNHEPVSSSSVHCVAGSPFSQCSETPA